MASSYSTDLKLELMTTGENSGTWGDKTNNNLTLIQQAIAGFQSIAITSTNTTLLMTDATVSTARNAVLRFTGAITANCTVFVASGIEKTYMLDNGTTGAFTLALNQVGGSSAIFAATDKSSKLVYLNGTDVVDLGLVNLTNPVTLTNKRFDPRVTSTASASSITPDVSTTDIVAFTALAANLTINAPIGTPVDGNKLIFRILDNGTSRTLTWNATFTVIGVSLPTATTVSKTVYVGCIYNSAASRWDVVSVITQV
jgi:hypothetical protein